MGAAASTGGRRGRWSFVAVSVALALAVAGAACGDDEEDGTPATTTTATAKATATATAKATTTATAKATATATPKAAASSGGGTIQVRETSLGRVLTDENGMTLYTFKNDPVGEGKSVCNGNCAAIWPPLAAPSSGEPSTPADVTGTLTVIDRDDGTKMIAYNGQPLYRYAQDTAPGETKGEGVGGNWFVARP